MARIDLLALADELDLDTHLPECPHWAGGPWRTCQWCTWALWAPPLQVLVDLGHDTRELLASPATGSVPWVVAASRVVELATAVDLHEVVVASVADLGRRLRAVVSDDLHRLGARIAEVTAAGGPVEERCLRWCRLLAAAALQHPDHAHLAAGLSPATRAQLGRVAALLSTDVQVSALLPHVDRAHTAVLPALRTQPEWATRPEARPTGDGPAERRGATRRQIDPGSLEALVIESVIGEVTEVLAEVGDDLGRAHPPVAVSRPADEPTHSSRTRSTMWRIAAIDWHLTFVDTGRATCWDARTDAGSTVADVPWEVALAIRATEAHGLLSATHVGRPTIGGDPPAPPS